MKISKNLFLTLLSVLLLSPLAARTQSLSRKGVKITVTKIPNSIKGFQAFRIEARNTTAKAKSVQLKIELNDRYSKEPAGWRGSCTVFVKLRARGSASQEKQCKEKKPSNSWYASIVKVFGFIPKDEKSSTHESSGDSEMDDAQKELDDMQKELEDMQKELEGH